MNRFSLAVRQVAGAIVSVFKAPQNLQSVNAYGGGWHTVFESRPEWWFQQDINVRQDAILANWIVFSCMTLIAGDVAKMRIKLVEQDEDGIREEIQSSAFNPVLRKPNHYQTRQRFLESWILSKLSDGNTYILKERDKRGVVVALYVLDPCRVKPLVAENGKVYYELQSDKLAQVPESDRVVVPASEIIHDRFNCLFHELVGMSPLFASGLAATQGLKIQQYSATFFGNMSRPSGILTAPGFITDDQALAYKNRWEENYGRGKQGQTAVLGGGLEYKPLTQNAVDSQMVEQLKASAEMICSTFHVPPWKVGVGPYPTYQNGELANQAYYDTALQPLMEAVEACLDEGLGLVDVPAKVYSTELDLKALLRMDTASQVDALSKQIGAAIISPNEARREMNRRPVTGGESPMIQQQNYSLDALAKRDASPDPFGTATPPTPPVAPSIDDETKGVIQRITLDMQTQRDSLAAHAKSITTTIEALAAEQTAWRAQADSERKEVEEALQVQHFANVMIDKFREAHA